MNWIYFFSERFYFVSVAGDAEKIAHDVVFIKIVFPTKVAIMVGLPEAAGSHMEANFGPFQADECDHVF